MGCGFGASAGCDGPGRAAGPAEAAGGVPDATRPATGKIATMANGPAVRFKAEMSIAVVMIIAPRQAP